MCTWRHDDVNGEHEINGVIELLKDLKQLGVHVVRLTGGGEPLSFPKVQTVLRFIIEQGFYGHLTTNGLLLTPRMAEEIVDMEWDTIVISVDGWDTPSYDKVRGKGNFERLEKNIKQLNKIKKLKNSSKPLLQLASVIMSTNYASLERFVDLCKEWEITILGLMPIVDCGTSNISKDMFLSEEQKKVALEHLLSTQKKAEACGINTNINRLVSVGMDGISREINIGMCYQPWMSATILPGGEVVPCCYLPDYVLGNVNEAKFSKIWSGEKFANLRDNFIHGVLPKKCKLCDPIMAKVQQEIDSILRKPLSSLKIIQEFVAGSRSFK